MFNSSCFGVEKSNRAVLVFMVTGNTLPVPIMVTGNTLPVPMSTTPQGLSRLD
jgi:hypothetical protein